MQKGTDLESQLVERLRERGWAVEADVDLDRFQKVDFTITGLGVRNLAVPIEVQVTLQYEHAKKLEQYLIRARARENGAIKVYVSIVDHVPVERVADAIHLRFTRDVLRVGLPNEVRLLFVDDRGRGFWLDPVARAKDLRVKFNEAYDSPKRKRGVIKIINHSGFIIQNGCREYYAYFTSIAEPQLRRRAEEGKLKPGEVITFMPTGKRNGGDRQLAECVRAIK